MESAVITPITGFEGAQNAEPARKGLRKVRKIDEASTRTLAGVTSKREHGRARDDSITHWNIDSRRGKLTFLVAGFTKNTKHHNENMTEPETSLHKTTQSDYCVELMARLNTQRERGNFCDVTIMVEGREFKAHRSVLSAASPFFDSMFTCNMKEKGQDSVCLEDISVSEMEYILDFIYTGDVQMNQGNAQDLMATANYLLLASLKSRAAAFLEQSLDISNCIKIYYFAVKHEFHDLVSSAREFVNSNFMSVSETAEFLELSHVQVKEWISSDDIIIGGEIDVFKVVLKWIGSNESGKRESNFPELFQSIRLTSVSRDYFFTDIMKSRLVRENPGCLDAVLDAAGEVAQMSGEYLPRQIPRKCLEKHEDAIVICGETRNLCYLPSHNSWYRLASRLSKQCMCSAVRWNTLRFLRHLSHTIQTVISGKTREVCHSVWEGVARVL